MTLDTFGMIFRAEPAIQEVLLSERPSGTFARWAHSGYLSRVLPELDELRGVSQLPAHRDDAFTHTLKVVDAIDPALTRRWAALLHDIAKSITFIETPDGRARFFDHDKIGAELVPEIMARAEEPPERVEAVQRLVRLHMRPIAYQPEWSDSAVRRLIEEAGEGRGEEGWRDLMALARADLAGYLPEPIDRGLWVLDQLEERHRLLEGAAAKAPPAARSPLDGHELVAVAQREPGPWVGELKEYLLSEVKSGRLAPGDKSSAEKLARLWLGRQL